MVKTMTDLDETITRDEAILQLPILHDRLYKGTYLLPDGRTFVYMYDDSGGRRGRIHDAGGSSEHATIGEYELKRSQLVEALPRAKPTRKTTRIETFARVRV